MTHHSFAGSTTGTRRARLAAPLIVAATALTLALSFAGERDRFAAWRGQIDDLGARVIAAPRLFPAAS